MGVCWNYLKRVIINIFGFIYFWFSKGGKGEEGEDSETPLRVAQKDPNTKFENRGTIFIGESGDKYIEMHLFLN